MHKILKLLFCPINSPKLEKNNKFTITLERLQQQILKSDKLEIDFELI